MVLASRATQSLNLAVRQGTEDLPAYLQEQQRVVGALLSPEQRFPTGLPLQRQPLATVSVGIMPTAEIQVEEQANRLEMRSLECNSTGCLVSTTIFSSRRVPKPQPMGWWARPNWGFAT